MDPALGLVIALPAEGRAVFGRFGWRARGARTIRRASLGDGAAILCAPAGTGPENARAAARRLIAEGATALAVTGVSGGLDPDLAAGDLIVAEAVLEGGNGGPDRLFKADPAASECLTEALSAAGLTVRRGIVLGSGRPALSTDEKRALRGRSAALAVDMESGAVARAAAESGVPLLVLRVICDAADRSVPREFFECLDARGAVRPRRLLAALVRHPRLAGDLLRTGRAYRVALASLRRAWRAQARAGLPSRFASGQLGPPRAAP